MGQKVHPYGFRLGINKTWKSNWYLGTKDYAKALHEDFAIRKFINNAPEAKGSEISDIEILRQSKKKVTAVVHSARPGIIIGPSGANIKKLNEDIQKKFEGKTVSVKISEVKKEGADSLLLAKGVARQLEGRISFRRAISWAINTAKKNGVEGIKIKVSGRLGGVDMARSTEQKYGRIPLHTLRANIDYSVAEALTTYGILGIKVWVYKGELLKKPSSISDLSTGNVKENKKPVRKKKVNNNGAKDA